MRNDDGLCIYTNEPPITLLPDDRRAVKVYFDAINISNYDANGLPTLDKLELIIASSNYNLDSEGLASLMSRIAILHPMYVNHLIDHRERNE